ncbi:MAG: GAP family protein [Nanoarchaeota archaeon]|nr:GAP family protein [Nanoarchaeota archaeon]
MVAELPALPILITTALVDSVNPCAIGVLILLIATLLGLSKNKKKMFVVGMIYILAVYITYLLAGIGLLFFLQQFNIAEPLGITIGAIIIVLGLVEIKDFWWYGAGFSLTIPKSKIATIKKYAKKASIPGAIVLGMFVAAVELPCTGGPYLAMIMVLESIGLSPSVIGYLMLYNFIFILPLITIVLMVYFGLKVDKIKQWKQDKRKWMRLIMGIIMIALGVLLILYARGVISIGTVG